MNVIGIIISLMNKQLLCEEMYLNKTSARVEQGVVNTATPIVLEGQVCGRRTLLMKANQLIQNCPSLKNALLFIERVDCAKDHLIE